MPFKFSRCLCLQTPKAGEAVEFYEKVMGLPMVGRSGDTVEFKAGEIRLFVQEKEHLGPIMEFIVPDLEKAKAELLKNGCRVVRWLGKGKDCFIRDPFGFAFNLWEDSTEFGK
jgi:catechol 2,3-dioxygenase-like lactoylglutathione lyase family enzyme